VRGGRASRVKAEMRSITLRIPRPTLGLPMYYFAVMGRGLGAQRGLAIDLLVGAIFRC
jgi:hypothetical protein